MSIVLLAALVFLSFLGRRDITTSHEARVAQTARQMAASGWPWSAQPISVPIVGLRDTQSGRRLAPLPAEGSMLVNPWLVPVINGHIRLQKPPLPYWCVATMFRLIGIDEEWVRFPATILGVFGALLIYDLARKVFGARAAAPAALVWITTQFLVEQFRIATADPYLAFFTLLSVWAFATHRLVIVYAAIALGMLSKGPVIFVTAIPAIVAYRLLVRPRAWSLKRPRRHAAHLLGMALFFLVAMPWYAYIYLKIPHALELWRYESIGELSDNVEKARPWWLYALSALRIPLPWTPMWIAGVLLALAHGKRGLRSPRGRKRLVPILWLASNLLFFSLANVKKDAYLLPVISAMALTSADAISVILALARRRKRFVEIPAVLATAQAAIGVGVASVVLVLLWRTRGAPDGSTGVVAGAAALLVSLYALRPIFRASPAQWIAVQSAAYAMSLIAMMGIQRAIAENERSPKEFGAHLSALLCDTQLPVDLDSLPEEVSFYLPLNLGGGDVDANRVVVVIDDNRRNLETGRNKPDAAFFASRVDNANILDIRRIPLKDDGGGRWKAYELVIDRSRALAPSPSGRGLG